ncbi:phenylacetate--CoA ligase family protein [Calycomorphotria hydatis]|uniref:Phenylacetate-coenzyme A ligase n=1 Tax=Calycomorphotria hydatis TaxID=2528027 RepID=A0A517TDW1_9PLAN|nr:AMP-binding protein [Calycomorphotria hydatis]QDT66560.1 Phenylacetate-coenzyme A ligase [Calycomorphotria hydatis]
MATVQPERLNREQLRERQSKRLVGMLADIIPSNRFWTAKYSEANIDLHAVQSVDDLAVLPFTTKQELVENHTANPPFGTTLTFPVEKYTRFHQTSGTTGKPMRWLDTQVSWTWFCDCWAQIFRLCGVKDEDRFFFPFSFGPFIGFWAAFEGASRLGYLSIPGGGMSSEARLKLILESDATVVCCTPTYALRLAEVAEQENIDLAGSAVRMLIVAGEPGGNIAATRERIETAWGAKLYDHWGMTEIGALATAAECDQNSLYVLESECIPEIINPDTLTPVPAGELGELVMTNLGRWGSPLIRYRTGDLVRASTEPSPLGLELLRLDGGILGRADDMLTIRGNNVFPSSIEAILREFPEVAEYRVTVTTKNAMPHLKFEIEPTPGTAIDQLQSQLNRAIKDRLNFQAEMVPVAEGSLPRFELKGKRFVRG